jgi:Icc-related predicted phosphoesterase
MDRQPVSSTRASTANTCDESLRFAVDRIKPKVHAFGHVHYSHGSAKRGETLFVNAAICTDRYDPWQKPVVVDLFAKGAVIVE